MGMAAEELDLRLALFFDYGQAAARREESASRAIAAHFGTGLEKVELPWLGRISRSALTARADRVPDPPGGLDGADGSTASAVRVENRNAILINVAAAWASATGCRAVVAGFNADEARTFPDNSEEFLEAVNKALQAGCEGKVRVESPTAGMDKRRIAREGLRLGIPWEELWSCYRGRSRMCGRCESCLRLREAVRSTPAESRVAFEAEGDRTEERDD